MQRNDSRLLLQCKCNLYKVIDTRQNRIEQRSYQNKSLYCVKSFVHKHKRSTFYLENCARFVSTNLFLRELHLKKAKPINYEWLWCTNNEIVEGRRNIGKKSANKDLRKAIYPHF